MESASSTFRIAPCETADHRAILYVHFDLTVNHSPAVDRRIVHERSLLNQHTRPKASRPASYASAAAATTTNSLAPNADQERNDTPRATLANPSQQIQTQAVVLPLP